MNGPFDFIVRSRVVGGIQFATNLDRCIFLGKSTHERTRWLNDNPHKWRRTEGIPPARAVPQSIAARANCESVISSPALSARTPSSRFQTDDGGEPDLALQDSLNGNCNPPEEPPSLPAPAIPIAQGKDKDLPTPVAEATATNLSSQAKPVVIEPTGSKQDHEGLHQPAKKKRKPGLSRRGAKRTHERMRIVLDSLRDHPFLAPACRKAGLDSDTVYYWLKRSAAGASDYDLKWLRHVLPFHEHYEAAMEDGRDNLKLYHWQRGFLGYDKVLKYRGRVTYKLDPILVDLGAEGPGAYLRDKNGKPIPETIRRRDKKSLKWLLKERLPETYGDHVKHDFHPQGPSVLFMRSPQEILRSKEKSSNNCPDKDVEIDDENDSGE
jgi:hypothetical protein